MRRISAKVKIISIILLVVSIIAMITTYIVNDNIREFIDTKILKKEISDDSVKNIYTNSSVIQTMTLAKNIVTLSSGELKVYDFEGNAKNTIKMKIGNPIYDIEDRYMGIADKNVTKIYNEYGVNTVEIIKNNPYVILDIVGRVGFSEIDNIAVENGIALNSLERLEASIKYAMKLAEQNGHTYVNKQKLVDFVVGITGVEEEYVLHAIDELSMKRYLDIEEEKISLESLSIAELEIATKLEILKNAKIKKIKNVLDKIIEIESEENIALTTEQRTAIISALENNVTIITGGPRNR